MIDRLWPDGWSSDQEGKIAEAGLLIAAACESTNHGKICNLFRSIDRAFHRPSPQLTGGILDGIQNLQWSG